MIFRRFSFYLALAGIVACVLLVRRLQHQPAAPRPLRLINLDERVGSVAAFLSSAGATRTVCQLEMVRTLP